MARAVNEFELSQELIRYEQSKWPDIRHHEQIESKQKAFVDQVRALTDTLEEMGNPILKKSDDLFVLDSRHIAHPKVAQTVRNTEQGRVLLKVVNPNVEVNVDVHATYVNFAFY